MRYGRRGKPVVAKNFPGGKPNSWGKLSDRIHEEEFKPRYVLITSCLNNQQEIRRSHLAGCWFIEAWHTAECHEPSCSTRTRLGSGSRHPQKDLTQEEGRPQGALWRRVMCQGRAGACRAPRLPPPGCGGCGVLGLLSPRVLQRGHSHAERGTDGLLRAEDRLRMASLLWVGALVNHEYWSKSSNKKQLCGDARK